MHREPSEAASRLDIVIPTLNSSEVLPTLLASLSGEQNRIGQVLVVDGGSTDETKAVAGRFGATVVGIDYSGDSRSLCRNLGAALATSDYVLFLDSDMEVQAGLIGEVCELLDAGADAVVVPEQVVGQTCYHRARNWEEAALGPTSVSRAARGFRVSSFLSVGMYDESLSSFEDLDLQARLKKSGATIALSEAYLLHHEEGRNWLSHLQRQMRYLANAPSFVRQNPEASRTLISPLDRLRRYLRFLRSYRDVVVLVPVVMERTLEAAILWGYHLRPTTPSA
jgi:glycosyltransferase involved in cell wall biosynthesis